MAQVPGDGRRRALPINELAAADAVYGYSFIVTNREGSTGERAAAVEHWYRHRDLDREPSATSSSGLPCGTSRPMIATLRTG